MDPTFDTTWEQSLDQIARRFDYPATPDIAAAIRRRTTDDPSPAAGRRSAANRGWFAPAGHRLAWALLIVALALIGVVAVPQTRAAVLSLFARIGAIDILIDETAPTAAPLPTPSPSTHETTVDGLLPVADTVDHSLALIELGEPTSIVDARREMFFPLAIPEALGEPDEVYTHRADLPAVTLVWRDPDGAPLSLTEIGIAEFANKLAHEQGVKSLRVAGRPAVWLTGPHMLQLLGNWQQSSLLIESNVLVWAADGVTYRLEGDLTEDEMVAIAESLQSIDSINGTITPMD